ncbi:15386_t:CDS:2, partial [Acaulospora morrowiae]
HISIVSGWADKFVASSDKTRIDLTTSLFCSPVIVPPKLMSTQK